METEKIEEKKVSFDLLKSVVDTIELLRELSFCDFDEAVDYFEKEGTINDLDDEEKEYIDFDFPVDGFPICVDGSIVKKSSGLYEVADSFSVYETDTAEKLLEID